MQQNDRMADGRVTSGHHLSYWVSTERPRTLKPLDRDLDTDVVIIGGGIAGMSIAYQLLRSGRSIALVEDGAIGSGETGRTSAHLVSALDDRFTHLEKIFGREGVRLAAESHAAAVDIVEAVIGREGIDCDFQRVPGYLFLHENDRDTDLHEEFEAGQRAGMAVSEVDTVPGMLDRRGPCLRFERQAQFHPLRYLNGLCDAVIRAGGLVFTDTQANEIDHTGVGTNTHHRINAKHVVVASNSPVNNMYAMHLGQYPQRTYVIGAKVEKDRLPRALWWDTGDPEANRHAPPYHYIRTAPFDRDHDLLLCGGEDHPTGLGALEGSLEEDRYDRLVQWARKHFPIGDVVQRWSGQVIEPMDSLGFIGRNPFDKDNVYIVTGDSGNGLTHGTIAGRLITDLITEVSNPWEKIYRPSRLHIFSSGSYFKEAIGGYITYMRTKEKPSPDGWQGIKPGEGRIVEVEGKKYGASRDEHGTVHLVDPECTHLKCVVRWNSDERTWDCPCHGSRFTDHGTVINGPATVALAHQAINENGPVRIDDRESVITSYGKDARQDGRQG
jgi:glycine/D-amino acid oxidase-like deaminating enzyme/nitrite reductase/ring-hydroxylating ferredoxin subunit